MNLFGSSSTIVSTTPITTWGSSPPRSAAGNSSSSAASLIDLQSPFPILLSPLRSTWGGLFTFRPIAHHPPQDDGAAKYQWHLHCCGLWTLRIGTSSCFDWRDNLPSNPPNPTWVELFSVDNVDHHNLDCIICLVPWNFISWKRGLLLVPESQTKGKIHRVCSPLVLFIPLDDLNMVKSLTWSLS